MRIKLVGLFCTLWFCFAPTVNASEGLIPLDAVGLDSIIKEQNNIVLINFWATWCRPCLEEIPILMKLEGELKESGFKLIPISLDEPESADIQVNPFIKKWFPEPNFIEFDILECSKISPIISCFEKDLLVLSIFIIVVSRYSPLGFLHIKKIFFSKKKRFFSGE